MPFRFGPCKTCCETCFYFSDDFNRSDDTDLGADWTEVAGAWEIASNVLSTASDDAICKCETDGTVPYVVRVALKGGSSGDEFRVIVDYTDSSNYAYVRITRPTAGTVASFIVTVSGGSHTVEATGAAWVHNLGTTTLYIQVCVDSVAVLVSTSTEADYTPITQRAFGNTGLAGGTCGLGTGTNDTAAVTFDSFSIQKHADTQAGCPRCSTCPTAGIGCFSCDTGYLNAMYLTLSMITEDGCGVCSILNTTYRLCAVAGISCRWQYNFDPETCGAKALMLSYTFGPLGNTLGVNLYNGPVFSSFSVAQWQLGSRPGVEDCSAFVNLDIPYTGSNLASDCGFASSVCKLDSGEP